jgi:hypothetical protein
MDQPPVPPILALLHASTPLLTCVSPPSSPDHTLLHLRLLVGRGDAEQDELASGEELIGGEHRRGGARVEEELEVYAAARSAAFSSRCASRSAALGLAVVPASSTNREEAGMATHNSAEMEAENLLDASREWVSR